MKDKIVLVTWTHFENVKTKGDLTILLHSITAKSYFLEKADF